MVLVLLSFVGGALALALVFVFGLWMEVGKRDTDTDTDTVEHMDMGKRNANAPGAGGDDTTRTYQQRRGTKPRHRTTPSRISLYTQPRLSTLHHTPTLAAAPFTSRRLRLSSSQSNMMLDLLRFLPCKSRYGGRWWWWWRWWWFAIRVDADVDAASRSPGNGEEVLLLGTADGECMCASGNCCAWTLDSKKDVGTAQAGVLKSMSRP